MANKDPRFYFDITRVDEDERLVYGYGTRGDVKDSYGTIIDLDSAARCMDAYMEYPAIREMHQMSAAGTAMDYTVDDAGIQLCAHIVDDVAWNKVKEGVYRGFSVGGKKEKQIGDTIFLKSITEFSLVDSPSNRGCNIDSYRVAGEEPMEDEQVQAAATTDVKRYAGEEIDDSRQAISALDTIYWLLNCEQDEANAGTHPEAAEQVDALKTAIIALKKFVVSEIKENTTGGSYTYTPGTTTLLELADKSADTFRITGADLAVLLTPPAGTVDRSGARNSSADLTMLQTVHDHSVSLGATCGTDRAAGNEDDVQRLAILDADVTRLSGEIDVLRVENATQVVRIAELDAQPEAPKAQLTAINRADDVVADKTVVRMEDTEAWNGADDVTRAKLAMKDALTRPQVVSGFRS